MAGKWSQFSEEQKDQLLDSLETGLYNHPEVGPTVKEAVEKAFGFTDPELAASRRHKAELDKVTERYETLEAQIREKEIRARVDGDKNTAQKKHGLTDDEMKEVSALMVEAGMGSYDRAAHYYKLSKQSAAPSSEKAAEHSSLMLPGNKELFQNPVGWARKEAYAHINETNKNKF